MIKRDPRMSVLLPARARWDGPWVAGNVQNVSRSGLMFSTDVLPPRGAYVEVAVGNLNITARAMWNSGNAVGLKARNPIDFELLRERRGTKRAEDASATFKGPDRRAPRPPDRYRQEERSRELGNLMQYVTFALIAVAVAGGMGWEVYQTLSAPASKISMAMAGQH
jgi:hypothetical protein